MARKEQECFLSWHASLACLTRQPGIGARVRLSVRRPLSGVGAQADIDRVFSIWRDCLANSGGPLLFGERTMADAMCAPVVTRFVTYDVKIEPRLKAYADAIMAMPEMVEWVEAARAVVAGGINLCRRLPAAIGRALAGCGAPPAGGVDI